jgi:hypothetical protein
MLGRAINEEAIQLWNTSIQLRGAGRVTVVVRFDGRGGVAMEKMVRVGYIVSRCRRTEGSPGR